MAAARAPALLADIGGTNARFALGREGEITHAKILPVARFASPAEAIRSYLSDCAPTDKPRRAALAFAGPVENGTARLTNGDWEISDAALRRDFGLNAVHLINDFAAIAWSVPVLGREHLVPIGHGTARPGAPAAVIGPGTGLGVAAVVPAEPRPVVLATEGGHVTMSPADQRESEILDRLRARFGHVSAERVLSGGGLENLYQAVAETGRQQAPPCRAEEIVARALTGDCAVSAAALDTFCAMLGTVAGNLALTLGATGGLYIAGGIVPRFVERIAASAFRQRFEAKGRFAGYLERIPTCVIVHPSPALLGLSALLDLD